MHVIDRTPLALEKRSFLEDPVMDDASYVVVTEEMLSRPILGVVVSARHSRDRRVDMCLWLEMITPCPEVNPIVST